MTELASEQAPKSLTEVIRFAEPKFNKIKPSGMMFDKEADFAIQILRNSEYLMKVASESPHSLVNAVVNVAAIGLSLNPASKEAYLIPRTVKNGNKWESRIFLEPSYMGLCNIATNTGSIEWIQARVVRKSDTFTDNGVGLKPTHIYDAFATDETRGPIVGVYCVAKAGGDYLTTIMNKEKLESIRGRSETWKKSIKEGGNGAGTWLTDEEEMSKKAVIRQAFKTWPKNYQIGRMEEAIHMSNENEGFEPLLTTPTMNSYTAEQKAYYDKCISNSDALCMYCFLTTLDEGVRTALHNSFEKGSITKFKAIAAKLESDGRHKLTDIQLAMEDAAETGDDLAVKELLTDMPQEAIDYIKANTEDDVRHFIDECLSEVAA